MVISLYLKTYINNRYIIFYVVILLVQYIGLIFINIKPLPYVCSYISLIIVFMIFGLNFPYNASYKKFYI